MNTKKVIVFGTFDIFHSGHRSYFRQAKKLGGRLIVVVARDINIEKIKGRWPRNNEQARFLAVQESDLADKVVLGGLEDRYKILEKIKPDIIALGYDQEIDWEELKNKLAMLGLESKIIRLKAYRPEVYKSSKL